MLGLEIDIVESLKNNIFLSTWKFHILICANESLFSVDAFRAQFCIIWVHIDEVMGS